MENYDKNLRESIMQKYCCGNLEERDIKRLKSATIRECKNIFCQKHSICLFELVKNLYSCLWVLAVGSEKRVCLTLSGYKGGCLLSPRATEIFITLILKNQLMNGGRLKVKIQPFSTLISTDFKIEKSKDLEGLLYSLKGLYFTNTKTDKTLFVIPHSPKKIDFFVKSKVDYLLDRFSIFNLFIKD